jgi:tRNA-uridine 2-sulfurtransferase
MRKHAIALFSGGLDSLLATKILQEQGFSVEGLNISTVFHSCEEVAREGSEILGIDLTVMPAGERYIELLRNPRYGFGKAINPCVDCRLYMCKLAKKFMQERDACVVITGEVLGQRPMSQKRNDMDVIDRRSGLHGRLLRPLSAKLLEPTIPEEEGLIDREKLYAFSGRGRVPLIELAQSFGIPMMPQPSTGCAITETTFAPRVRDVLAHQPDATLWDLALLNHGRHFRLDEKTKVSMGRNLQQNETLIELFNSNQAKNATLVELETLYGPTAILVGDPSEMNLKKIAGLVVRYASRVDPQLESPLRLTVIRSDKTKEILSIGPAEVDSVKEIRPI